VRNGVGVRRNRVGESKNGVRWIEAPEEQTVCSKNRVGFSKNRVGVSKNGVGVKSKTGMAPRRDRPRVNKNKMSAKSGNEDPTGMGMEEGFV
jgi:hypothetical protein